MRYGHCHVPSLGHGGPKLMKRGNRGKGTNRSPKHSAVVDTISYRDELVPGMIRHIHDWPGVAI